LSLLNPSSASAANTGVDWVYAAIMLAAVVIASWLFRRTRSRVEFTPRQRIAVAVGAFCGGMLGAKLPFVIADSDDWLSGGAWLHNGKTIMFGLVGGYFGVEIAKWLTGLKQKTGDAFAVPVAVAIGIGRLGCFWAGCCYGTQTSLPWACRFGDGLPRHPTQIYEAIFHVASATALSVLKSSGHFRGQLIKLYFLTYFAYRFVTEFIRPEPVLHLGLTGYQWAAAAFVPLFVLLWIADANRVGRTSQASLDSEPGVDIIPPHNRVG
jgi:phosphatidylglycerol:prolipoprotein diacylglycerol transferase